MDLCLELEISSNDEEKTKEQEIEYFLLGRQVALVSAGRNPTSQSQKPKEQRLRLMDPKQSNDEEQESPNSTAKIQDNIKL